MIPSVNHKKVKINITVYKNKKPNSKPEETQCKMNESNSNKHYHKGINNRFICSICLNSNSLDCNNEFARRVTMSCPKCRQSCDFNRLKPKIKTTTVQTSQTDINQDLNLLKEVLTVFQNTKQVKKNISNTTLMKDVSVETENKADFKQNLSKSRIFQYEITEDNILNKVNNFRIIHYSEPDNLQNSQFTLDLNKRKSSSIPQMKIDELKYSLKEKTKSKDAIEEVNRMFATVRRNDNGDPEDQNRPFIRTGPRVLPVVRPNYLNTKKKESQSDMEKAHEISSCKCYQNSSQYYQANDRQLSGGDSFFKHECCYYKAMFEEKCDKCVYTLCCHCQKCNKIDSTTPVCEHCNEK
ncbi:unnamed protein product [Diatraea saccharalis]|uniref:Uncharacterized protein n=1 Tax=Diatraea saccharalis TaxID=40085 RepID=A0A9N9RDJ1_9NEOP|nr:unnamed protein product [Diatraea saccharalis]